MALAGSRTLPGLLELTCGELVLAGNLDERHPDPCFRSAPIGGRKTGA